MICQPRSSIPLSKPQPASVSEDRIVLIVEDCVLTRKAACEALRSIGCTVLEAVGAQDAIRILNSQPVDVVFVDVHLPSEAEGLLVASYARIHQPKARLIVTSGKRRDGDRQTAEMLGSFIAKPYLIQRLVQMVDADRLGDGAEVVSPEPMASIFTLEPRWEP